MREFLVYGNKGIFLEGREVRHSTPVRYGKVRYSTVREDSRMFAYGGVRYGTMEYGTVRYVTVRHSRAQYGTVGHSTAQYGTVRHSTSQYVACFPL